MALSKAKALQDAEKSVAQGKIGQAIKLYLEILDHDTSDVSLYNTVGDLCIRDRNITEGLRQFHRLAEAFVQQGFNVKAIAIYRKISKIDPNSVDVLLKLAELYQLQGLGREAREQYLQAAEFFKRRNQVERTLDVLRRLTLLDPENTNFRNRLAGECEQAGKREEAVAAYLESAEASLRRSDLTSADIVLKKAVDLEPKNSKVQLLRAKVAISRHQPEDAEKIIEPSPELAANPEGKKILLEAYLSLRKLPQAEKLVREVFRAKPSDFTPVSAFVELCLEKDDFDTALQILSEVSEQLIRMHSAGPLIESLRQVWSKSPQHIPTLQLLHRVCERAPDELTLPGVLEALGQAYVQKGDLEKAAEVYRKLCDREPENEQYRGRLKEILRKRGKEDVPARPMDFLPKEIDLAAEPEAHEGSLPIDGAQQAMVKEALENSDLFARYHLVEKAVGELEKVLQVYPDQIEIHQRILEICRKGHPERAHAAASALTRISAAEGGGAALHEYQAIASPPTAPVVAKDQPVAPTSVTSKPSDMGTTADFPTSAIAPGEASEKASAEPAEIPFDLSYPGAPSEPLAVPSPPSIELDLSGDLEANAGLFPESAAPPADEVAARVEMPSRIAEAPAAPPRVEAETPIEIASPVAEASEDSPAEAPPFDFDDSKVEVDFYLENGFVDEAWKTVATLEAKFPGNRSVAELREHLKERSGKASGSESGVETTDGAPGAALTAARAAAENPPVSRATTPPEEELLTAATGAEPANPVKQAERVASHAPEPAEEYSVAATSLGMDLLGDLAGDFSSTRQGPAAREEPVPPPRLVDEPAAALPPQGVAQLSGLLAEMEESGAGAPPGDDPETHYSLGVAFREMGLLDEAIGEFQKVVRIAGKGNFPPNFLQACTLLAICFMDKKMPAVAVKWYLRALGIPGLEDEAALALEYDLGVAYELIGDTRNALERFTEVYSQNIDFRDVTVKIRELQQKDR
jgi:pilus assembly protein FimV